MQKTTVSAPAKINLALHVVGQRDDGYHLLDSIVCFTFCEATCDQLAFEKSGEDHFFITGRFGSLLDPALPNLVTSARDALRYYCQTSGQNNTFPVSITLDKRLPIAAGIGGGSADAAAVLRGLVELWEITILPENLKKIALNLGADVPMCLSNQPVKIGGVGEKITPLFQFPETYMVLVNPLISVSTPSIFKLLKKKENAPINDTPRFDNLSGLLTLLKQTRNDLQLPATNLVPEINDALQRLEDTHALISRMSGSGATCFGLYPSLQEANAAAKAIQKTNPNWYVAATKTIGI